MPTVTWTLAKGIPPRVRSPETKKKSTKPAPPKNKRKASKSDNDSSNETSSESGDSDPKPKPKRKAVKRQCKEPESDTETVDGAEPEPMVEEVEQNPDSDDEVHTKHHIEMSDSHINRGMGLMTINEVKTFANNQQKRNQHSTSSR